KARVTKPTAGAMSDVLAANMIEFPVPPMTRTVATDARGSRRLPLAAMCGRFVSSSSPQRIAAYFGADVAVETLGENYNVAPTNDIYGVVADADGHRTVEA